jgi:hypothetical protein
MVSIKYFPTSSYVAYVHTTPSLLFCFEVSLSIFRSLSSQNDLTFLRVRSKKHEIMVAPGSFLFVLYGHFLRLFLAATP